MYTTYKDSEGKVHRISKSDYVNMIYDQNPTWSYNKIAKRAKCSKQTVSKTLRSRGVYKYNKPQSTVKVVRQPKNYSGWNTEVINRKSLDKHIVEVIAPKEFVDNYKFEITAYNQMVITLK